MTSPDTARGRGTATPKSSIWVPAGHRAAATNRRATWSLGDPSVANSTFIDSILRARNVGQTPGRREGRMARRRATEGPLRPGQDDTAGVGTAAVSGR